jgi:hypothetical protein
VQRGIKMTGYKVLAAVLWILVVALIVIGVFVIKLPADAQYNRKFASRVTMAYDQATFEGMKEQVLILWSEMNETFKGFDYNHTYCSPWYWEQTYDNSLSAQQDYFKQLTRRLDSYSALYQKMLTNMTNPVYLEDWYSKSIQNFRDEMKREGGLDWAISGAWYLNFAPAAYWLFWWLIPLEIVLIIVAIVVTAFAWEL